MKKLVLLVSAAVLLIAGNVNAQSFSVDHDTVSHELRSYQIDEYNYIHNLESNPIQVKWKIYAHNLPQDWIDNADWGLCDNIQCYDKSVLAGGTQTTDPIAIGDKCLFKGQINGGRSGVTSKGLYYYATELWEGTTKDTAVFVLFQWPTNVVAVTKFQDDVILYPNPARAELNVIFNKGANIKNVAIYNLVGKQVGSYRVNGSSAKLDIDGIPSGIYYIRLIDNTGRVTATRRFTHQ